MAAVMQAIPSEATLRVPMSAMMLVLTVQERMAKALELAQEAIELAARLPVDHALDILGDARLSFRGLLEDALWRAEAERELHRICGG